MRRLFYACSFFDSKLLSPRYNLSFAFNISLPLPYESDSDHYAFIFKIIDVHLVFVADIGLKIATIFLCNYWKKRINLSFQSCDKFRKSNRIRLMTIWDFYEFLSDALDLELFSTDCFREKLVSWYGKMSTRIISIIILSKEPNSEHPNRDDLTLDIPYSNRFTNLVSP